MAERLTAERQLARILQLIPLAGRKDGATLRELAEAMGCTEKDVMRDLQEVYTRAYYQRPGSIDDIQIAIDDDRVSVWTTGEFQRPLRLGPEESIATALALRVMASGNEDLGDRMRTLAEKLEASLFDNAVKEAMLHLALNPAALTAGGLHEIVANCATDHRACRIRYLKTGADMPEDRTIDPYVLVNSGGRWYAIGWCHLSDGIRVFRLDRVLEATATDDSFVVNDDFRVEDYLTRGRVFRLDEFQEAAVRYSPRVARYIAEEGPVTALDDGSAVVRYALADRQWLIQHLLEFGPDAELLEPAEIRQEVVALLRSMVGPATGDNA